VVSIRLNIDPAQSRDIHMELAVSLEVGLLTATYTPLRGNTGSLKSVAAKISLSKK
jgi:hypothetical protein